MSDVAVSHRVPAERLVLLGWSRAILLQLAHPLVAAGVHEHSDFRGSPIAAAARLHHTVGAMLSLVFGGPHGSRRTIDRIRGIHTRVNGTLSSDVGPFRAGTRYSAEDPALVLWVHATLVDSMLMAYERLVATLSDAERDAYCAESVWVAVALGAVDAEVPRTWPAMSDYMARTMESGMIAVGPQARELCRALLWPSLLGLLPGSAWLNRLLTADMLPEPIRAQYGFELTRGEQRLARRVCASIRVARRFTPDFVALWPSARHLERVRQALPEQPRHAQ
jgi:uncharacterized protein (DUF2236 family)